MDCSGWPGRTGADARGAATSFESATRFVVAPYEALSFDHDFTATPCLELRLVDERMTPQDHLEKHRLDPRLVHRLDLLLAFARTGEKRT